jgi:hypothetical protein
MPSTLFCFFQKNIKNPSNPSLTVNALDVFLENKIDTIVMLSGGYDTTKKTYPSHPSFPPLSEVYGFDLIKEKII